MSNQKPKGIRDVKITQKDVDDFFDSIHTKALADSIKMSYKPTFKVKVKKTRKFHSAIENFLLVAVLSQTIIKLLLLKMKSKDLKNVMILLLIGIR